METSIQPNEHQLHSEIEDLRRRCPRTHDLYREVCVLLFFHHGVTPTVNKLYQLVRKGSMSAPTEALNHFWKTLRERSRVTIEHSDLPDELRIAAGDLVATLWRSAQLKSQESLAALQADAVAVVDNAKTEMARARTAQAEALQALEHVREQLRASDDQVSQLRQELAAAAATKESLNERLEDARSELRAMQTRMDQSNAEHIAERERLADRTRLAEDRFADMEKRALLEIDRERTATAKLQKTLGMERAEHATAIERARSEHSTALATIGHLREQIGALQNAVEALRHERDRERADLQSVRIELELAVRQAAAESARVEQLREELERTLKEANARQKPLTRNKRRSKENSGGDGA
jgi:chromosome segregation ATPase